MPDQPSPKQVLIVDDELLARKKIRTFLKSHREFEVIGECANGNDAVAAIQSLKPDLVFLDIRIPGLNGVQVLESLPKGAMPCVIFVTAYDKYAVQAFELQAIDYLLKPFNRTRFAQALDRATEQLEHKKGIRPTDDLLALLRDLDRLQKPASRLSQRLVVKSGTRVIFLDMEKIEWVEAERDYVRFHLGRETCLVRDTMTALLKKLDPQRFARIHRSTIVNLDFIKEMQALWGGDYTVRLKDGTELTMSRSYRASVQAVLPERPAEREKTDRV